MAQVTSQSLAYLMTFMQTAYSAQPSSAEDALAFRRLLVSPPNIVNLRLKCTKKCADKILLEHEIDDECPKFHESGRAWTNLGSQTRNTSFSERQTKGAFFQRFFF